MEWHDLGQDPGFSDASCQKLSRVVVKFAECPGHLWVAMLKRFNICNSQLEILNTIFTTPEVDGLRFRVSEMLAVEVW